MEEGKKGGKAGPFIGAVAHVQEDMPQRQQWERVPSGKLVVSCQSPSG